MKRLALLGLVGLLACSPLQQTVQKDEPVESKKYSYLTPKGFEASMATDNLVGILQGMNMSTQDTLDLFILDIDNSKEDSTISKRDTLQENWRLETVDYEYNTYGILELLDKRMHDLNPFIYYMSFPRETTPKGEVVGPVINAYKIAANISFSQTVPEVFDSLFEKNTYDLIFTGGHGYPMDSVFVTLGVKYGGSIKSMALTKARQYYEMENWIDLSCGSAHKLDSSYSSYSQDSQCYVRYTKDADKYIPAAKEIKEFIYEELYNDE